MGAKLVLGTQEADAEVVTVDGKLAANLVFVLLFPEDSAKDGYFARRKLLHDLADLDHELFGGQNSVQVNCLIWNLIMRIVEGIAIFLVASVAFAEDILASCTNESPKTLGLANAVLPELDQNAGKGFLSNVLDLVGRDGAAAQHHIEERLEIGEKVLFDGRITVAQTIDVCTVEREKFQNVPQGIPYY